MPMNQESVWQRLIEVGPFASEDEARRAFEATLRVLRRGLSEDEADWLAVALGPELAAPLLRESYAGELPKEELYRWMKRYTKLRKGVAVEHAQVVCRVLAERLPDADLERLRRHLPQLGVLLERPVPGEPWSPKRPRRRDTDRALGGAGAVSRRPLGEEEEPQPESAHPSSIRGRGHGEHPFSGDGHGSARH